MKAAISKTNMTREVFNLFHLFRKSELYVDEDLDKIVASLIKDKPQFLISDFQLLLEIISSFNLKLPFLTALVGGMPTTNKMRQSVASELLLHDIKQSYNCWECGHIAWECKSSGLHVNRDYNFLEILDNNDEDVDLDETGKVVVTNLTNFRMPLIRYELNDYAKFLGECDCGTNLSTIDDVIRRKENVLVLPNNKIIFQDEILNMFLSFPLKYLMTIEIYQQRKNLIKIFYHDSTIVDSFVAKLREKIGDEIKLKSIKSKEISKRKWIPVFSDVEKFQRNRMH